MPLHTFLETLKRGENLSADNAREAFDRIFSGTVPEQQIADFLLGLRAKGETVDELLGAATSMRSKMISIQAPQGAMDIVGTGGDAHGTFNISTAVALVVAACGIPVAKHGNKATTSLSGSSDVLSALGIHLTVPLPVLERCLKEANLCFLFAPNHHPAMRHVAEVRKKLGVRTIFNLLGPLTNPANVRHHLIGVYDLDLLGPVPETLKRLGSETAWVAHGHDGMDEITTTGYTDIVELRAGLIQHFNLNPEQIGLPLAQLDDLKGRGAAHNAEALKNLILGQKSPYRDIVLFNASAALVIAGKAADLRQGLVLAETAIDNGAAQLTLDNLIHITNETTA